MDYDIFGHAFVDAVKTQFISKIGSQIGPALNEAMYAFDQHFDSYPGSYHYDLLHSIDFWLMALRLIL